MEITQETLEAPVNEGLAETPEEVKAMLLDMGITTEEEVIGLV